ncbi:MAG: AzlC family ABC transporter permease [Fusobacterium sp. JB021]|nr:AzlC family ABC transporter permease [Fusobacterium sp. JB021]MDP0506499.1 AzlC family ABC transporter permease [Fusobacterium sp. JB019]MDP0506544.1 AzlC family ABC transporter permease [Fusobacterium sp. JB019]
MESLKKCNFRDAITDGTPIVIGFIPIAMAFGILCKSANLSLAESVSFSLFVFAGASQFIAVNLLIAGASMGEILLTTLLVNMRHVLFSASISPKISLEMKNKIPFIAFGLTDETFSVASLKNKELTSKYMLVLEGMAYSSFIIGTFLGYVLGGILPKIVQTSMGIALYSLFVAILIPALKKSNKILILVLLSGIMNTVLTKVIHLAQGWSIVVTILFVSFLGLVISSSKEEINE